MGTLKVKGEIYPKFINALFTRLLISQLQIIFTKVRSENDKVIFTFAESDPETIVISEALLIQDLSQLCKYHKIAN